MTNSMHDGNFITAAAATSAGGNHANRARRMPYLRKSDLRSLMGVNYDPKLADNWMSLSEDIEFLPILNNNSNNKNKMKRTMNNVANKLRREGRSLEETDDIMTEDSSSYNPYSVQPFVEGMSEYDEYQQAWRLLGFMIDCNGVSDDDYKASGSGSGDQATEDGCARYVLWAAYVDLEYEGGGIGEYQYWDRETQQWDATPCDYAEGNSGSGSGDQENGSRCAKMDCHLEDTHFSVLGFFKHRNYDDWMEQLFKHEGMCVWSEEEYAFMKNARKAWPKGCIDTGKTTSDDDGSSTSLYYNIKPLQNGQIAFGLYTDEQCIIEYPSDTDMIEDMLGNFFVNNGGSGGSQDEGNYDFSGDSLSESMSRWDSAFDVWHICHPCVAHDLNNTLGDKYTYDDDDGDDYYYNRDRKLGGEYSAQGDVFECYDDAGYTNVNQCMKFSAKTIMKTATFQDLTTGRNQGSLVEYPLYDYFDAGDQYSGQSTENLTTYFFLASVTTAFFFSLFKFFKVANEEMRQNVNGTVNQDSLLT